MEIWKDIEGYEGLYQISNLGRVKSLGNSKDRKEKNLKPVKDKDGYLYVVLCKEGKCKHFKVHRLVASVFIEKPFNFNEVNHKDENKENNSVDNLEWCDRKYNVNYGSCIKRMRAALSKQVKCIETGKIYSSTREAERKTGIAHANISSCCNGKYKTAGKFHWEFV